MSTGDAYAGSSPQPGAFETFGKQLDERPEIQAAEAALREAREQFERAQNYCQQLRSEAATEIESLRGANVGDLLDKSLAFVRRNPGAGVCFAAIIGYFLGRLFRR
ncbi:MAG: hypothetical protein SGJ19_22930 [Planctomycetia bacterium]|nr:hypothetical protein [Planctomycetia bacterium]